MPGAAPQAAAPPAPPQAPPPAGPDLVAQLGELARLREAGMLSPTEFEAAKAVLLRPAP